MNILQRYKAKKRMIGEVFFRNEFGSVQIYTGTRYKLVRTACKNYCLAQITERGELIPDIDKHELINTWNCYHKTIKDLIKLLSDPRKLTHEPRV